MKLPWLRHSGPSVVQDKDFSHPVGDERYNEVHGAEPRRSSMASGPLRGRGLCLHRRDPRRCRSDHDDRPRCVGVCQSTLSVNSANSSTRASLRQAPALPQRQVEADLHLDAYPGRSLRAVLNVGHALALRAPSHTGPAPLVGDRRSPRPGTVVDPVFKRPPPQRSERSHLRRSSQLPDMQAVARPCHLPASDGPRA